MSWPSAPARTTDPDASAVCHGPYGRFCSGKWQSGGVGRKDCMAPPSLTLDWEDKFYRIERIEDRETIYREGLD